MAFTTPEPPSSLSSTTTVPKLVMSQPDAETPLSKLESSTTHNYSFPLWRRCLIVVVTSWMTLAASFSSTSLLSAASEIAQDFHTTSSAVNIANAGVLLAMGFATFIWGPIGIIVGRRAAYNSCIVFLFLFTIGAALAPNMRSFVVLRILSGLQGTYFHVSGQAILAEYFPPVQRGTATGFFLAGTVLGPPLGPCVAGIIITFESWRVILWLQAAMVGLGFVMSMLFIPLSPSKGNTESTSSIREILSYFNPLHIFSLMLYPNVFFANLACGLLSWSQYAILAEPRHILSTRFHLTSPLISGLFYISPAAGFLLGTLVGGRWSDWTVRKWIVRRDGTRLPQDRLNSGMISFFFVLPVSTLLYGWGLQYNVGGLAFPIVLAFFTAAGLLAAFASLNTYCAEVMPQRRLQVIASKYCIQYIFGASSSAASNPLIDAIGIGPTSTIGAAFIITGGILSLVTAKYGIKMQKWVDERLDKVSRSEKPTNDP